MFAETIRLVAFVLGLLFFLGGIAAAGTGDVLDAAWAIVVGAAVMIATVLQNPRYRAREAERVNPTAGPGAGEPGYLEPRFVRTAEVFVDPTSGRRMRVFADPRTGERRYLAED